VVLARVALHVSPFRTENLDVLTLDLLLDSRGLEEGREAPFRTENLDVLTLDLLLDSRGLEEGRGLNLGP
ncbi:hypothetical protein BgiBS90_036796, partial [Biomphalaria glabrata]